MSKTMLLYKQVRPLNREEHKGFRLKPGNTCEFAAGAHLVPLAGQEFFQSARHYPIVFIGEGENIAPIAMLGMKDSHNAFVEQGQWATNHYVPAFVRRYPFVLSQGGNQEFTVCIDSEFEGWSQEEGQPLFDEAGANTPYLDEMIRFLQSFTNEMERTRSFVAKLRELDLLDKRSFKLSHVSGETFLLSDFMAIDEEKFTQLGDDQILALHKDGFLGWIYAHLMSLGNVNQLFERHLAARKASDETSTEQASAEASDETAAAPKKGKSTKH